MTLHIKRSFYLTTYFSRGNMLIGVKGTEVSMARGKTGGRSKRRRPPTPMEYRNREWPKTARLLSTTPTRRSA